MGSDLVAEIGQKIFLGILLTCALSVFSNVQADETEGDDSEQFQSTMFETNKELYGGQCRNHLFPYFSEFHACLRSENIRSDSASMKLSKIWKEMIYRKTTCGHANEPEYDYMIIRGNPVDPPYKYPWMVAIKKKETNEVLCGGSILNEYYVLSAAHCYKSPEAGEAFEPSNKKMEYISSDQIFVSFVTKTHKTERGPPVKAIIPHPGFHMSHMKHDIALLKLSRKLICNQFRSPICLPPATHRAVVRGTFTITGWGTVKADSLESSKYLREAKIKLVDFSKCEHRVPKHLKGYVYCLLGIDDQGPCVGDSGGPMFNKRRGKYYIWGVTSFHTSEKCYPDEPFTYTPVFRHLQWIKKVMGSSSPRFI